MEQKLLARGLLLVCAYTFLGIQAATAAIGTTAGSFDVTTDGAASYQIPITAPPGTAGMEPNLRLQYSSGGRNGLIGVGWSLGGLSHIGRCDATYAQDGFIDGVDFDSNDRLCLDGARLVAVSGTYGQNGAEYRTELERFARVQQNGGDLNSGDAWFEVRTKDGLVKQFGRRNSSAFAVPGKPYTYVWSVDRISDTVGNYIEVEYAADAATNEQYVVRIDYTANDQVGRAAYNSVRFEYDKTRSDKASRYMNGGSEKITSARRLSAIKTYTQDSVVREYNLTYTPGPTSGLSRLTSLEECAYPASGAKDCLPATTFEWTTTTAGFTEHPDLVPPFNLRDSDGRQRGKAIDVNGDGLTDFVKGYGSNRTTWLNTVVNGQQSWQTSADYRLPRSLFTGSGKPRATLVDVNGDGLPDLVEGFSASNQRTYINTGSGWVLDDTYRLPRRIYNNGGSTDPTRVEGVLTDLNGDGLTDLVISTRTVKYDVVDDQYTNFSIENEINEAYLNQDNTCSTTACRWQRAPSYDLPRESLFMILKQRGAGDGFLIRGHLRDMTGDGLPDYAYIRSFPPDPAGSLAVPPSEVTANTGTGWSASSETLPVPVGEYFAGQVGSGLLGIIAPAEIADVNADGLPDLVCSMFVVTVEYDIDQSPVCGPATSTTLTQDEGILKVHFTRATYLNTGDGYLSEPAYNLPDAFFVTAGNVDPRGALFHDLNDDGRPEFIKGHVDQPRETYVNQYGSQCATEGCKWKLDPDYRLPFDYFEPFDARVRGTLDQFDLDGRVDFVASAGGVTNAVYITNGSQPNGDRPDLIKTINPGNSAATVQVDYTTLLDNRHFSRGSEGYPSPSVTGSQSVVAESVRDVGASTDSSRYEYEDLRANLLGRGTLGFRKFIAESQETGIRQAIEFNQVFPYTGMILSSTSFAAEYYEVGGVRYLIDETALTRTVNSLAVNQLGSGASIRYFPHVATADEQVFDLGDDSTPLTTSRTETTYDDFGNATEVVQKQFQGASPGLDTHTTVTTSQYTNDTSQWLLGRLTSSTVTKTNPDGDSVTRETAFEYDAVTGLLTAEITEPNDPDLRHRTDYQYDAFGNQTEVTVSGTDIESRTTTTTWDNRGQFKTSVTNALGHTESYTHSQRHGGRTSLTGPNDLTTTWTYDAFGREVQRTAPDGTTVTTSYEQCGTSCPVPEGVFAIRTTGSDGSESLEVFDRFERTVLEAERGYDGSWIDVVTQYDNRDRKIAETAPHYRGAEKHWTTYEYDDHDRVVRTESPTNQDSNGGLVTEVVYDGLIVRQIDANGKVSEKHENAAGRVVKVVDALNNTTEYDYDPYGNKTRVTDAAGNVTTITYDKLGRKIAMSDPDMGDWTYTYDVLGNMVEQTDAKDQTMQLVYDKLDRRVTRKENPEEVTVTLPCPPLDLLCWLLGGNGGTQTTTEWEETTWTYDTAWVGELAEEALPEGFERSYVYDGLGRVQDVITVIDSQTYTVSRTYDGQSRLKKLTYPSGFAVQHHYTATGYLDRITDDDTGQSYWQLDYRDAFGNVELASYGNGHSTVRNHDNARGHIDAILTGTTPGTEIQSLNYEWDKVGNLLSRIDQNQSGLTEEFEYDDLYRLTGSTLNGSTNLSVTYDEVGNITSKSGVGSYSYGAGNAGPHAVTQITGNRAATYSYDANGNMTDGDGRTFTWTSFNKPASIDKGSAHSAFRYDPDRARYKHVREREEDGQLVNATIHYVGDLYEREHEGTGFEEKHYIRAGGEAVAMQIHRSNGTQDTHYLHKDHLGSITAITDAGGNIVERYAYDAFGKRRGLAWDPDASDSLLYLTVQVLDRGYTGHEHLDHVALIHMNGRVYDPVIGRITSADPFVQFPESTQGLNRYAYVHNNPLSYTDPSGFFLDDMFDFLAAIFISPYIPQVEYAIENPRKTAAFALVAVPGGQILGGLEGAAAFWVATGQGFAAGMVASRGDLKAGLLGAATAGAFWGVGEAFQQNLTPGWMGAEDTTRRLVSKTVIHGAIGGTASDWAGGSFTDGFLGAATNQALGDMLLGEGGEPIFRVGGAALIGGTAAELGGGKFANGAITAAFGQAFNEQGGHGARRRAYRKSLAAIGSRELPSLAPGQYQVAIDALSVSLGPIAIEAGDLWLYNPVDDRIVQFRYTAFGAGVGIGGSFSRQYGFISISSTNDLIGASTNFGIDGVPGIGGGASFYSGVPNFSPGTAGGLSLGLHGGFSWTAAHVRFNKSYAKEEAPMIGMPW